jgi:hypothetical protein
LLYLRSPFFILGLICYINEIIDLNFMHVLLLNFTDFTPFLLRYDLLGKWCVLLNIFDVMDQNVNDFQSSLS